MASETTKQTRPNRPGKTTRPSSSKQRLKDERDADFVMATNSSSIVSKRSVERLYLPEPHYFRHFVRKPQRRAPIINRGYWLRMQAIEHVIRCFLRQPTEKRKVIVNLGCGYDPMPFQWLGQHAELCQGTTFVDIDYPDLMKSKVGVIEQTPQIQSLLGDDCRGQSSQDSLMLETQRYYAVGCDLGNTQQLDEIVNLMPWLRDSSLLYVAEVSVTYMDVEKADNLIAWAAQVGAENQFTLLEQFLPDGPTHPFAATMLRHFHKLRSPLKCISKYPSIETQEARFLERSWVNAEARNLWELWSDPAFLTPDQRSDLDKVEPFDEWEEYALFASHYFLLHAATFDTPPVFTARQAGVRTMDDIKRRKLNIQEAGDVGINACRKYGAALLLDSGIVGLHSGSGTSGRSSATGVYHNQAHNDTSHNPSIPPGSISPRSCHTITQLHDGNMVLIGGRASPAEALRDCWISEGSAWKRVSDLPIGLYRHCCAPVTLENGECGMIVCGGKETAIKTHGSWLLWTKMKGWLPLEPLSNSPTARFGANMVSTGKDRGVIFGGMTQDGVIIQDFWTWDIVYDRGQVRGIHYHFNSESSDDTGHLAEICRFGATAAACEGGAYVVGGIARSWCVPQKTEILFLDLSQSGTTEESMLGLEVPTWTTTARPLLVGHSSLPISDSETLILGGGAVCFSFGSFWNNKVWLISSVGMSQSLWTLQVRPRSEQVVPTSITVNTRIQGASPSSAATEPIERRKLDSVEDFDTVIGREHPCIFEGLDIGPCTERWTNDYLKTAVGMERQVIVHEAATSMMSFHAKDFKYVTRPFAEFLDMASQGANVYLRSLSNRNKSDVPTVFDEDYPELAADFKIPPQLSKVSQRMHSSPFRISTAGIWLHYDVQANCLFQVRGSKKLILYPPEDVLRLQFPAGSTTSGLSIFDSTGAARHMEGCKPIEVTLEAGDVLYIPPLWPHTAAPVQGLSIAINIFFRNLDAGYAVGRDVYGNRDLQAYENGRKQIEKLVQSFERLPRSLGHVYLQRLADELLGKANELGR